jgi:hypothetical protein
MDIMTIEEKLIDQFESAVIKLFQDECYEFADPNRESAYYARLERNKLRKKILKRFANMKKKITELQFRCVEG